ncbi:hypothetical protein [Gaiella sp.]|uniref:hypothetical protein n=1 Tax=Gaiella sp. TaxID=2663207 RepID=UPI0032660482
MTDRREHEDSTTATRDDLREAGDKAGDAVDTTADKAKEVGRKASDKIEDMIPGDSDGDGH